jgi:hypothetical protein
LFTSKWLWDWWKKIGVISKKYIASIVTEYRKNAVLEYGKNITSSPVVWSGVVCYNGIDPLIF